MPELDENSLIGRVIALFPILFALIAFAYGMKHDSLMLFTMALFFLTIGIWTLFAKGKVLFDSTNQEIRRYKKWLWFEWVRTYPVQHYEHVSLLMFSRGDGAKPSYCVNLKYNGTSPLGVNDIRLKCFPHKKKQQAIASAQHVAQLTGLAYIGIDT